MLKKLVAGEYSLKVIFWMFGLIGILFFNIIANITHSGVLRAICQGRICTVNIVWFIMTHIAQLMTGQNGSLMTYLALHLIVSACFVCYLIILLRGLWKCSDVYEGAKFWSVMAKVILLSLALLSIKSIL